MATRVNLGAWLPDQPGEAGALTQARNVYPVASGYAPMLSPVNYSNAAAQTLLTTFSGTSGGTTTLFAGSAGKLYKLDPATLNLSDVSVLGGYSATFWDATQFGKVVIAATNGSPLQAWTLGTSVAFANLSASAPTARYVTVVRDFVVAAAGTGYENRVRWSDINDETDWVSGSASQADTQDIPDGGEIRGITGGEFGLVLSERAIHRMSYVGAPLFFQFDNISRGIGCYEAGSVAQYGALTFFLSDDGFYSCDGNSVTPIGAEKVDRTFFNSINVSDLSSISTAVDPLRKLVIWNYKSSSGAYAQLIYHWPSGRWSEGNATVTALAMLAAPSVSLDAMDSFGTMDSLTTPLDSRQWAGGRLLLGGVNGTRIVTLDGAAMTASITTGDIHADTLSCVTAARPVVDNGSATVAIASRSLLNAALTYGTATSAGNDGRVPLRSLGRYHRLRLVPTGSWTYAQAVEVDLAEAGQR